jgi:hypothetical protein
MVAGGLVWFMSRHESEPSAQPESSLPPVVTTEEPPPEAPPSTRGNIPTTGILVVTSNIPAAWVFVDRKRVGQAPFEDGDSAAGLFRIRVEREGYSPFEGNIRVRPGRTTELAATLKRHPPSLRVTSDVQGATVFMDRKYIGTTPVDVQEVFPGEHQLTLSAEGFDMHAETVTVTEGHHELMVSFKSAELNEGITVIHKHRMGRCEGSLIAENTGLRYETENKKDGFILPYSDLERFEVDYVEKNMNLKVRGGRNYNFTEQSGNADTLFVFHKNVSAYIQRMPSS